MLRLLFEKTGNAIWMSHLDLMRLFQRAFKRAGLPLTHTQGFNPRPSVSIALPLSVGVASHCELLDFDLDGEKPDCMEICDRLNSVLVDGLRVYSVYENGSKIRDLALLDCCVRMEYDNGIPNGTIQKLQELFAQTSLCVEKRSKNGVAEQDMIPMIRSIRFEEEDPGCILIYARVCCQNPTLNPAQLVAAVERYLPECKPDYSACCRLEIYDEKGNVFR